MSVWIPRLTDSVFLKQKGVWRRGVTTSCHNHSRGPPWEVHDLHSTGFFPLSLGVFLGIFMFFYHSLLPSLWCPAQVWKVAQKPHPTSVDSKGNWLLCHDLLRWSGLTMVVIHRASAEAGETVVTWPPAHCSNNLKTTQAKASPGILYCRVSPTSLAFYWKWQQFYLLYYSRKSTKNYVLLFALSAFFRVNSIAFNRFQLLQRTHAA